MEEDTSTGLLALGDLELLSILDYLDVITLTKVLQSSKRMLLLAEDLMDRSPCMVSDVLPIDASAIRRHLLSRMQSKPTMCIVFNTNESEKKSAAIDQAMAAVLQSMPPTLALKYIENHSVQHGVQYYPNNDDNSVNGNDGVDKAVIMLGAFPEARTCCFMLSRRIFAAHAADIDMMLRSAGLNNPDADWKVFIITVSSSNSASFAPEFISNLQKRYPNASILGGLTSHSLIGVGSKGCFLSSSAGKGAEQACVSVLAMGGNVPLHTCVSRGVQKVSEVYDVPASDVTYYNRITRSESRDVKTDVALIGKVVGKDSGMTAAPSAAIEKALQLTRGLEGIMVGTRTLCAAAPPSLSSALSPSSNTTLDDYSGEHEDGFDLTQVHSNSVLEDGRLVHFVEESAAAPEQLQLFQMTPEACRSDIGRTLNMAKERFTRCGLEVMGCLLITCSGRGPEVSRLTYLTHAPYRHAATITFLFLLSLSLSLFY